MKRDIDPFIIIEAIVLLICICSVTLIMLKAGGWQSSSLYIHIWAVLPYITFFILTLYIYFSKKNKLFTKISCILSILMLIISLGIYIDGLFYHSGSLSVLLFYYVPLYLIILGPITLAIIIKIIDGK